jgi:muramoyltetrapeptide carboxypeptidase LdcA involved in peptidoglycan recycling
VEVALFRGEHAEAHRRSVRARAEREILPPLTTTFTYPPKPSRGARVAVLSPSGRAAAHFPAPLELGLSRLRSVFGLVPVEYPTTRAPQATPAERAADVHAAFADPDVGAVLTTIGGEDELKVLAHLDDDVLAANPKPFLGYSDNTNLHIHLWRLGVVSYHGGAVMVQFGRPGSMHPMTTSSLERALLTGGRVALEEPPTSSDEERDWSGSGALATEPEVAPAAPWSWHGSRTRVTGPGWGGSLEIVDFHLRASRYLLPNERYEGAVLFLETSEELPPASYVYRVLMGMGERGLLQRFAAVLWARPKAWSLEQRRTAREKEAYVAEQRAAVLAALDEYHPGVPLVFGVDFGHTDPQLVLPSGGEITVDGERRRIEVLY